MLVLLTLVRMFVLVHREELNSLGELFYEMIPEAMVALCEIVIIYWLFQTVEIFETGHASHGSPIGDHDIEMIADRVSSAVLIHAHSEPTQVEELASRLAAAGMTSFQLSRDDYRTRIGGGSLPAYLGTAQISIEMVSISIKLTHDEGQLIEVFRRKLFSASEFRIVISLLNPASSVVESVAASLDLTAERLRGEITEMLRDLNTFRTSLPDNQRKHFKILLHNWQPMGSAILKDATPHSGVIQVETKLYRAPRVESFGYEVSGPSEFYHRNYTSWKKVIDDSFEFDGAVKSTVRTKRGSH
jgi:hypothetical protein